MTSSTMSDENWCRLCVNRCSDYIQIYDETDQYRKDVFEITVKYFHPMVSGRKRFVVYDLVPNNTYIHTCFMSSLGLEAYKRKSP